jgi:asparagine synthase (glutamine-hydrolysing)
VIPVSLLDRLHRALSRLGGSSEIEITKDFGQKLHKVARALATKDNSDLYLSLLSLTDMNLLKDFHENRHEDGYGYLMADLRSSFPCSLSFETAAMECDLDHYLVENNLFKMDRSSMAASLEVRLPMLDIDIVEFASRLALSSLVCGGRGKLVLRDVLARYVPPNLTERPKMGFSMPVSDWLRNELRGWFENVINLARPLDQFGLDEEVVDKCWACHQSQRRDYGNSLWSIMTYLLWFSKNRVHVRL